MAAGAENRKTFKQLLLLNQGIDFEIILQEGYLGNSLLKLLKLFCAIEQDSLGDRLQKLLKPFRSVEQNGHQGYK